MFSTTFALLTVLSLSGTAFATPARTGRTGHSSITGSLIKDAFEGTIEAIHHYTDHKYQQQQQQLQQVPAYRRNYDEMDLEAREDLHAHIRSLLEVRNSAGAELAHLAVKYGGRVVKEAIPAVAAYFESKQQPPQQQPRSHDEEMDLESREEDFESFLEARASPYGKLAHLAVKYGGTIVKEAIPAFAAHFESKHQHQPQPQPQLQPEQPPMQPLQPSMQQLRSYVEPVDVESREEAVRAYIRSLLIERGFSATVEHLASRHQDGEKSGRDLEELD